MAGETAKTKAICLSINPWSQTSHIVSWLTPEGKLTAAVKGAVRPKSAFLGQYDLNYVCEIVYYLNAKSDIHALRECAPLKLNDFLRSDYRKLLVAEHFRTIASTLAPQGPDANEWFNLLEDAIAGLENVDTLLAELLAFEIAALKLIGLSPEIEADLGAFTLRGERKIAVSPEVAKCIRNPRNEKNLQILVDTSRVIGVFYTFHLDEPPKTRRYVIQAIQQKKKEDR